MPPPVSMSTNKVDVLIDGVPTSALVDTGATVSVMSSDFKTRIGRKVMFCWEDYATFRAVSKESLRPKGVCTATVTFGSKLFKAEFAVIVNSTHDVILG